MKVLIASLVMGLVAASSFAQDPASAEASAAALNQKMVECWNAQDASACAALYTEDATSVDPGGQAVVGRAAIEAAMAQTFEMFGDSKIAIEQTSFRAVNDDLGISDGTWTVTGGNEGLPTKGFFSAFIMKVNGEWLVASDQAKIAPPMPE